MSSLNGRTHLGILGRTTMAERFKALIDGVFRGFNAPADMLIVNSYAYPHRSELEAMRGDWNRVGSGILDAMKRVDVKAAS